MPPNCRVLWLYSPMKTNRQGCSIRRLTTWPELTYPGKLLLPPCSGHGQTLACVFVFVVYFVVNYRFRLWRPLLLCVKGTVHRLVWAHCRSRQQTQTGHKRVQMMCLGTLIIISNLQELETMLRVLLCVQLNEDCPSEDICILEYTGKKKNIELFCVVNKGLHTKKQKSMEMLLKKNKWISVHS